MHAQESCVTALKERRCVLRRELCVCTGLRDETAGCKCQRCFCVFIKQVKPVTGKVRLCEVLSSSRNRAASLTL